MLATVAAPSLSGGCVAFLGGTVGGFELLVLFAAILLLFGPRRLPEIARTIGRLLNELRHASDEFRGEILRIDELPPLDELTPDPEMSAPDPESSTPEEPVDVPSSEPEKPHAPVD
jgi:Sec-independent protein translocase protein TatA